MTSLKHDDYVQLVEQTYFGNVAIANIDAVLDCFTDDALITIRHGDNPLRIFRKKPLGGETPLRQFYSHLCENFEPWFGNFIHYIDIDSGRCACTFTVKLTPKQESDYRAAGIQTLDNCNFFSYENGKITEMTIYYSNIEAGEAEEASASGPTGYPK